MERVLRNNADELGAVERDVGIHGSMAVLVSGKAVWGRDGVVEVTPRRI